MATGGWSIRAAIACQHQLWSYGWIADYPDGENFLQLFWSKSIGGANYTMFALPNRLMMECEQYGANVFEVIDLINRDYPRGGMPLPGFTAGWGETVVGVMPRDTGFPSTASSTLPCSRPSGFSMVIS